MKIQGTEDALAFLKGEEPKTEAQRHEEGVCGCKADYPNRVALLAKGLLWLQGRGVSDRGLAILGEKDDELNRRWCEDDLATFRNWWRDVVREASC